MRVSYSKYNMTAAENMGAKKAVYISGSNEVKLACADSEDTLPCIGFTEYAASISGTVTIYTNDVLGGFSGLTPSAECYLSQDFTSAGEITTIKPTTGLIIRVGVAKTSSELDIHILQLSDESYSGSEFVEDSSEGESSTTALTYQQKLRLTTGDLPSGKYRIGWSYQWRGATTTIFKGRVQINDSITIMEHQQKPKSIGLKSKLSNAGFYYHTGSGVLNIDLDYCRGSATGGGTAYIQKARLEIWRVKTNV